MATPCQELPILMNRKQLSPVEGQSLQQKDEKRRKRTGKKNKKPKDRSHLKILISEHATLMERKACFHVAKFCLSHENLQNVQKMHFLAKSSWSQWVKNHFVYYNGNNNNLHTLF